jgi:hypothetical protein
MLKLALNLFQMYAMLYFCKHELVVEMIYENDEAYIEKAFPGVIHLPVKAFHSGCTLVNINVSNNGEQQRQEAWNEVLLQNEKNWAGKGASKA